MKTETSLSQTRSSASRPSISSATPAPWSAAGHDVGPLLERGQGVGDGRRRSPHSGEEGVVVLGVADGDDVVRRQAQLVRARRRGRSPCSRPTGRTITAPLLKITCEFEAELADHLEDGRLVRLPGGDDHPADRDRPDPAAPERRDERRRAAARPARVSARSSGRYSSAPFSATTRSNRSSRGRPRFSSSSSRPVTRISLRPDAAEPLQGVERRPVDAGRRGRACRRNRWRGRGNASFGGLASFRIGDEPVSRAQPTSKARPRGRYRWRLPPVASAGRPG